MRLKGFILSLGLLISSVSLSSCSAFFGSDAGYLISDMNTTIDNEGNTVVTITFDNEEVAPLVFTIPKGMSGSGIKNIESSLNSDGTRVILTIHYDDESKEPTRIEVPIVNGVDGKGISNVIVGKDESGNTTIQFEYSDGTKSEVITVNKGVDGVGIDHIEQKEDILNNRIVITVYYTNEETTELYIPLADDGTGIKEISTKEEGENYILVITYTDDKTIEIPFKRPLATSWFSGKGLPQPSLGYDNDFYFDENSGDIYKKINGTWNFIFSMSGSVSTETITYKVTFNVNGGKWRYVDGTNIEESEVKDKVITVDRGSYINLNSSEYEVYKDGYTFTGWWTDLEINPNSGHFTTLTPVMSDLTLYAQWEVI